MDSDRLLAIILLTAGAVLNSIAFVVDPTGVFGTLTAVLAVTCILLLTWVLLD